MPERSGSSCIACLSQIRFHVEQFSISLFSRGHSNSKSILVALALVLGEANYMEYIAVHGRLAGVSRGWWRKEVGIDHYRHIEIRPIKRTVPIPNFIADEADGHKCQSRKSIVSRQVLHQPTLTHLNYMRAVCIHYTVRSCSHHSKSKWMD